MITVNNQVGEARESWGINPVMKRHLELEIKTLQNAPTDEGKLRELLELKEKENEQKKQLILKILKKVSYREIEMLKVVLFLVCRNRRRKEQEEKEVISEI
jgi:F0F1-type ATP synthase delta subunit